MPSRAQREFTAKLDALLQEGLSVFGMEPSSQLGDWCCILSAPFLNADGDLESGYSITFSGNLLEHNALGLLEKGRELLETGQVHEDDD